MNDFSSIGRVSQTRRSFRSLAGCVVSIASSLSGFLIVGQSVRSTFPLSMETGRECLGTAFHLAEKIPRIRRPIKDLSSSKSTATSGFIPKEICVFKLPRRGCSRMSASNGKGCFVTIRIDCIFFLSNWVPICTNRSSGIVAERIVLTFASISRRHVAVRVTVVFGSQDIQGLYVGFVVKAVSNALERSRKVQLLRQHFDGVSSYHLPPFRFTEKVELA